MGSDLFSMNFRALQHTHLLAAVVFLAAVLVLVVQLITPSPVLISVGENGTQTTTVGQYFTYPEVSIVGVAAFVCGVSSTYLVIHDQEHVLASQSTASPDDRESDEANPTFRASSAQTDRPQPAGQSAEDQWEENLQRLSNNQHTVYELLIEAEGELPQRELVEQTDFSKATVSRTLDKLEHRGLVERKRSGMGNTVRLE